MIFEILDTFLQFTRCISEISGKRRDQYLWMNHGPKSIPVKKPVIQKRYFVAKLPDGRPSKFHKSVYTLLNDIRHLKPCIIQYMGSMDGIAISAKRPRNQGDKSESPSSASKRSRSLAGGNASVNVTRPAVVIQRKLPITKNDFKQLHELAYNLNGFVNHVQIAPTFQCVIAVKDFADHLEAVLQSSIAMNETVLFSYCSSYEIGGLILSPLLYSHIAFDGKPAVPSHFVIHEKNDVTLHQEFFRIIQNQAPSFKTIEAPIITEGDLLKDNCIQEMGLNLTPIASWKAVVLQAKEWLYENGATQQEVATGLDDMRKLMSSESLEKYEEGVEKCKEHWGASLQEYYAVNIDPAVRAKLGRWLLDRWGIFNPYTGVNDGRNDCLEIVIQNLQALGNASAYTTALACYLVQQFVKKDLKDSLHGMGRFIPRESTTDWKTSIEGWKAVPFLCLPDNIVHYIKNDQLVLQDGFVVERAEIDAKKTLLNKGRNIYDNGGVHHNGAIQAFVVKEWERPDESFLVKLHPRATCTCDSAMFCQHIIAVKISIGIDMESEMERLDAKFVTRALKSCENAAEGIKPRRRRRKKQGNDLADFGLDAVRKRESSRIAGHVTKGEPASDEGESENENDITGNGQDGSHVDFFQAGGQIGFNMNFQ